MKKTIYLTDNSPHIREELAKAGIKVCVCCSFRGYGWLNHFYREETKEHEVHAVMGCDEEVPDEKRHAVFLSEAKEYGHELVECHNVEEFIKAIKDNEQENYPRLP